MLLQQKILGSTVSLTYLASSYGFWS